MNEEILKLAKECGLNTADQLRQAKADALREAAGWFAIDGNYGNPVFILMKMAAELEKQT